MHRRNVLKTLGLSVAAALNGDVLASVIDDATPLTPELLEKIAWEMLPAVNRDDSVDYIKYDVDDENGYKLGFVDLAEELRARYPTVGAVRKLIRKQLDQVLAIDRGVVELREGISTGINTDKRFEAGVFYTHVGLIRVASNVDRGTLGSFYDIYLKEVKNAQTRYS